MLNRLLALTFASH